MMKKFIRSKSVLLFLFCISLMILNFIHLKRNKENKIKEVELKVLIDDETSKIFNIVAQNMEQRRRHLNKTCHELGLDVIGSDRLHKPHTYEFLVNHEYKLIWCPVYKAAASSWTHNFNLLAGYSPEYLEEAKDIPMNLARIKYPHITLKDLNVVNKNYTSFIIVRHPFERIMSSYKDKFYMIDRDSSYYEFAQLLIRTYRSTTKKVNKKTNPPYPKFKEFVNYLIDLNTNKFKDRHWIPISTFCSPCLIHFDYILKFETFSEDQSFLIKKANISNIVQPIKLNSGNGNTKEFAKKYYSRLTKKQIHQLYEIFRYDFLVFNYTIENYLKWARP